MKNALLVMAALCLTETAAAQKLAASQVPAATVATFRKAYPAVKAVTWEKEAANYEAAFRQGKVATSVVITATGRLLETETGMPAAQLPAAVRATLARQYQGYQITETAKIVTAATGATFYEAEVRRAGRQQDVLFRADGTPVKP